MPRLAGIVLVLLASATLALGSPVCCLVESGCCGSGHVVEAAPEEGCCPNCAPEKPEKPAKPAPKPGDGDHSCICKSHASAAADEAPAAATPLAPAELPTRLPEPPQAIHAPATVSGAAPPGRAQLTLPLLL